MSSTFGYLIPDKPLNVGLFREVILSFLNNQKVIDGYYEEKYQWYAAGDDSHSIFVEKGDEINPAFEYVEIHDTINNRIIPDCTSADYGAKCANCKTNLDEILSEILIDLADQESENGNETDMALLVVNCESCHHNNNLRELEFELEVKVANQFACFVEIDSEFNVKKLNELASLLDCKLDIIYGAF